LQAGTSGEGSPLEKANSPHSRTRIAAIGLATALLVAAAFSGYYVFVDRNSNHSIAQPAGLDYFRALNQSDREIGDTPGGPWSLISVLAITATAPLWPFPFQESACEAYPGGSIWNSSRIPVWIGSLSSGISPFWSLWYLNSTRYIMSAVSVNQSTNLVGPISPSSPCGVALAPTLKGATPVNISLDTTIASQVAWNFVGSSFSASHPNLAVYYEVGAQQLVDNSEGPGWGVTYGVCGLPGFAGDTLESHDAPTGVFTPVSSPSPPSYYITESDSCSSSSYNLSFGEAVGPVAAANGSYWSSPFTVATDGLLSWMTVANLTENSTGSREPLASISCNHGELTASACHSAAGWYAALANSNGYWLDVYGDWNGTTGWALPNVPYDSGNNLVVFLPSSIGSSGLVLSVGSVTSAVQVTGSLDL
jgi:hypothetical protein